MTKCVATKTGRWAFRGIYIEQVNEGDVFNGWKAEDLLRSGWGKRVTEEDAATAEAEAEARKAEAEKAKAEAEKKAEDDFKAALRGVSREQAFAATTLRRLYAKDYPRIRDAVKETFGIRVGFQPGYTPHYRYGLFHRDVAGETRDMLKDYEIVGPALKRETPYGEWRQDAAQLLTEEKQFVVNADQTRLQQLVTNLALNSRDAMPDGGDLRFALFRLKIQSDDLPLLLDMPPGEWMQIDITDTGTGIPPEILPHIFEPFFTTKPLGEGTGLGLAQVFGIVKQHDGYIDVKTEIGIGTTFMIYFHAYKCK